MDEKKIEQLKPYITNYIRNFHSDDIISEKERVVIDLEKLYNYGIVDFIEYIYENPYDGLKILEDAYVEAYYALKNENPNCSITIKNIPEVFKKYNNKTLTIKDIKSSTLGKLIEFEGIIVLATKIKSILKKAVYVCNNCGNRVVVNIDNPYEYNPESKSCTNEKCNGILQIVENESEYIDFQELKVQQPLDLMDDPEEPPKYISVFLENSPGIFCGRVKIIGIPIKYQSSKKLPIYDIYIRGLNCEIIENKLESELTEDDIEKIEKVAKHPKVLDILSNELIPEIKGYETIKKAIFLQQIKGVKKGNKRADSHILLITDPGIGKSVMLRKIAELPGNLYGSVTTASGVGLTAAVVREKTEIGDDTWVIKPGLLVKANKGTACIDELTVNKDLQSFVLEAMESQTIHINKGGINTKLPAECAILAACNPRWGKFDPNVSIPEQINIPAPMLSRFDIIFPIKDEVDRAKDKDIAKHIINIHRKYLKKDEGDIKVDKETKINGVEIDDEFIIKYILYARQKKPIISKNAEDILVEYYTNMRKSSIQITARQLEAAIRLAEAHAKVKLKDVVEEEDAEEAINIIMESLKEIAYDPETGMIDIGKITGESNKDKNKMKEIYTIIKKLSEKNNEGLVLFEDILEETKKKGMDEEETENIIKKLLKRGDIDEPRNGKYRII
ncbi:minichromosome maintenance protein MCM [Methanothermococcus sp. Ax23]|uniref:ATP-binding protein n=1 Tax=Methanothermococcus sp. Ax23 TaxID=3156486 RepID=UPI003B9F8988